MGSSITCPDCKGSGKVETEIDISSQVGAAFVGLLAGSLLGGPLGGVAGVFLGVSARREKTCGKCRGSWKITSSASATPQTRTPANWNAYGGKTMTMYHGTSMSNATSILQEGFKPSSGGMLGKGVYLSADRKKAEKHGNTILTVQVKLGKVKKIDSQTHPLRTLWSSQGFDSAWVPANCGMVGSRLTETCVLDPDRIRVVSLE